MYRVRVTTPVGEKWLGNGSLRRYQEQGTKYQNPSTARYAVEGFARRREEQYSYVIVSADGGCIPFVPRAHKRLTLTFTIDPVPQGGFRVYAREASCEMVVKRLTDIGKIAVDWAEQVEADL